jgi:hypothetical protein
MDEFQLVARAYAAALGYTPGHLDLLGLRLSILFGHVQVIRPGRSDGQEGRLAAAYRVKPCRRQTVQGTVPALCLDFLWVSAACGFQLEQDGMMPLTRVQLTLDVLNRFRGVALLINSRRRKRHIRVLTAWIPVDVAEEVRRLEYGRRRLEQQAAQVQRLRYPDLFWSGTGLENGRLGEHIKHLPNK